MTAKRTFWRISNVITTNKWSVDRSFVFVIYTNVESRFTDYPQMSSAQWCWDLILEVTRSQPKKQKYQISPAQVSRRVPWIQSVESQHLYTRCRVQRTLVGFLPALCCHVSLCCCSALVFYELNSRWRNKKPEWTLWRSSCLHRALNSTPLCLVSGSTVQLIHYLSLVT